MAFKKGQSGNKNGRPKGTITKPRLSDYLTEQQVNELVKKAYDMAATGDPTMLKFILEHQFGKPVQPLGNDEGRPLVVQFDDSFTRKATGDSSES